ncbi:glycosyltransferase [Streptomyces sp. ISL-10]|uniref:glycosyltransferase n=1 Tax=Streptomyces sp. ISL-10 TaxID=2819172 RepID=UPI0035AB9DC7
MRILITTAGSRGDVAPFTGLGRRLPDAGHQVAVAAHPSFAAFVGGAVPTTGLAGRPAGADPGLVQGGVAGGGPGGDNGVRARARRWGGGGRGGRIRAGAHRLLRPGTAQPDGRRSLRRPRNRHLPRSGVCHQTVPAARRTSLPS